MESRVRWQLPRGEIGPKSIVQCEDRFASFTKLRDTRALFRSEGIEEQAESFLRYGAKKIFNDGSKSGCRAISAVIPQLP